VALFDAVADTFTARHVLTLMVDALTVGRETDATEASNALLARGFDIAPVLDDDRLLGWVTTAELARARLGDAVEGFLVPLSQCPLISADASVGAVVEALGGYPFVFVLDGREFSGFITPADLDRPASRVFFYVRVADVECRLFDLIARLFGTGAEALAPLQPARIAQILGHWKRQQAANLDLAPLTYAGFPDLVDIVAGSDLLLEALHTDAAEWRRETANLVDLRNRVMHAVKPLVTPDFPVSALLEAVVRIDDLRDRLTR
jgi:hypothetical protein